MRELNLQQQKNLKGATEKLWKDVIDKANKTKSAEEEKEKMQQEVERK